MSKWGGVTATYYFGESVTGTDGNLYTCIQATGACIGINPVGDAGVHWRHAAASTVGDVTFTGTTGPVVADTSNGHTYRLKSTAGTIGVTQVT